MGSIDEGSMMNGISGLPFKLKNAELFRQQSYVHGQWIESKAGGWFNVVDPGTGEAWASCPNFTPGDVDSAVQSSHDAFQAYKKVNPRTKAQMLLKWDSLIREHREDLALILTYETGKPYAEACAEIDYGVSFVGWFAGEAERINGTVHVASVPNRRVFTVKQPIGVAVGLVPWNFPIAMSLRKVAAALAAGCTMIVKPSPETPFTTLSLAYLAEKAGFAPGVFNVVTTDLNNTPSVCETLCKHPLVSKVTFTGSTRVGKLIAKHCAEGLKKVTLELGGNCPYIIFDDADLEHALTQLMALKFKHAGQVCVTANRVYVQSGVYDKFSAMLAVATRSLKIGHGTDASTTIGPVTTPQSLEKLKRQVEDSQGLGGQVLVGGKQVPGSQGYFFEPTVITGMTADMLLTREETFGPICALYKFDTEDEVVKYANDTSMGLASYFFTKCVDRTWRLLENLEAGMIGMNTGNSSGAENPFGGIKQSGYGKESGKDVAVAEYLVTKTGTLTLDDHY
ncbi:succinate-semialdehyde dehydrogenase [Exophiala aquamarina CBS 119918]|uniref:Succinate-semialdehyde dehydrogenase n=1 Tax=Exophiala aquamarina CBS 119918 TaxID=1182545 RepID=A0A072PV57_9EURO|nr:succinate-semialdehyde dehydrogenase [Exophiala aquamarina CBS 119918]KEF59445.1 succinate-semialdehyde dehydrogenase [Exophiala aquamarina CBS 119918]